MPQFGVVFRCAGTDECGQPFKELKYHWNNKASHVSGGAASGSRGRLSPAVFDGGRDIRYALLSKGEGPGAAYVALFVARSEGGSTPPHFAEGFKQGFELLLEQINPAPGEPIYVLHGTTVSTNTVIERSGARLALFTTRVSATFSSCSASTCAARSISLKSGSSRSSRAISSLSLKSVSTAAAT